MPSYNFYCIECGDYVKDYFKPMNDRIPACFICGGKMEIDYSSYNVAFKGFTTPGGNGRPGGYKKEIAEKLPEALQSWYKAGTDPDFHKERQKHRNLQDGTN